MIVLNIAAENFEELKQKTFEALGLKEPAQMSLPLSGSSGEVPAVEKTSRTRRTKAEIAAEKVAVETHPDPVEPVVEEVSNLNVSEIKEEVSATTVVIDHDQCRALLAKVIEKHGMERAIAIIKPFGVAKVPLLPVEQLPKFFAECQAQL